MGAPAEPPPALTDSQRIRITLLRERLGAVRRRKEDTLHKVCELDAEEAGIAEIFQQNRGALVKTYHGYFIAPEHAEAAIPVPTPPPEETSWSPLVRKLQAQADKERANWKKLGQGPQSPGHDNRAKTLKSLLS
jgi:hypothetical protein